ncbi:MAG: sulfatase-like hydrolase/transferase [Gemmataceae bacterium]
MPLWLEADLVVPLNLEEIYRATCASLDMPPSLYIEDDCFRGVPTVEKTWIRTGPAHKNFEATAVLPTLTDNATAYVRDWAREGKPFFLYLALPSPHTPVVPTAAWKGQSKLNAYADFVMQTDDAVGQVLRALDTAGLADNTLVIFTSDNGCSPQANLGELHAKGHQPGGRFRGHKADIFDGGHRVPFLVRWPGRVKPGATSDQLVCLTDLLATCAEVVGERVPAGAGEDSVSLLSARTGAKGPGREAVVHHSIDGSFAVRQGRWKLCLFPGTGGWSKPRPGKEDMGLPPVQLYDMGHDPGETTNLHAQHPEVVGRLTRLLRKYGDEGCSTPEVR